MLRRTFLSLLAATPVLGRLVTPQEPKGTLVHLVNRDAGAPTIVSFVHGVAGNTFTIGRANCQAFTDPIPYNDPAAFRAACLKTFGTENPWG